MVERQPRRRGDRLDELRVLEHRAVVDQHRDALAVGVDRGDRPLAAGLGQRERPAGLVGVAVAEAVAELERRVAERARQPVAQRHRLPQVAEVDHEPGDRALRPAAALEVDEQRDRERDEHDLVRRERRPARCPASAARRHAPSVTASARASGGDRARAPPRPGLARGSRRPPRRPSPRTAASVSVGLAPSGSTAPSTYAAATTACAGRRAGRAPG